MILLSCMKRSGQWLFLFFPRIAKLSKFQREEYAKLWFNLALLLVGSLIIKIFEPGVHVQTFSSDSFWAIVIGLIGFIACVKIGLYIGKENR